MLTDPFAVVRGHIYATASALIASAILSGVVGVWRVDSAYAGEASPMAAMKQMADAMGKGKKLGEERIKSLKNELKQAEKKYGKNSPQARDLYVAIGNSHVLKMDFIGQANHLKKALKIQESITGKESVETIDLLMSIHHAYAMTGLSGEGNKYLKKAEKIASARPEITPKQKLGLNMARDINDVFQGKKDVGKTVNAMINQAKELTANQSQASQEHREPLKPATQSISSNDEQAPSEGGSATKRRALLDLGDIDVAEEETPSGIAARSSIYQNHKPTSFQEHGGYDVDLKYTSINESNREKYHNEPS